MKDIKLNMRPQDIVIRSHSWVKGSIQWAICIQAGNTVSSCSVIGSEIAPDNDFPVALKGGGRDIAARSFSIPKSNESWVKGGVNGAGLGESCCEEQ